MTDNSDVEQSGSVGKRSEGLLSAGSDIDLTVLGSDLVPSTVNVHRLLDLLDDQILNRNRAGPVVYVVNSDQKDLRSSTVSGFERRLVGGEDSLISHASSISSRPEPDGDEPDVFDFLDGLVGQLEDSVPSTSKQVSFSSYWLLRSAMQIEVGGIGRRRRRREIKNGLFADTVERRVSIDWFKEIAQGGPSGFVPKALFTLVARLPRVLYGVWLKRPHRTQWISEQLRSQFLIKKTDLLSTCLYLNSSKGAGYETLTLELLIESLLHDLSKARNSGRGFRQWSWRPWRTVLLFPELETEKLSPTQQICRTLIKQHEKFPDHVLVLAGAEHHPSWITETDKISYREDFRPPGGNPSAVVVELGSHDSSAQSELDTRQRIPAPLERPPFKKQTRALALLACFMVLSVGSFTAWKSWNQGPCRHVDSHPTERGGIPDGTEFVGITDGGCLDIADGDQAAERVLQQLEEQNNDARELAAERDISLRTVAYLTPVSPTDGNNESATLQQLRGALAQQSYANEEVDTNAMQTQLLIADPGHKYQHQGIVVTDLNTLIKSDDSLTNDFVGVAGVSESWEGSSDAIELLDDNNVAVIGAAVTGSSLSSPDTAHRNYVQVSPNNIDMAQRIVNELDPTERAVIVFNPDPDDLFSEDLKNQLETQLSQQPGAVSQRIVAEIPYKNDDENVNDDGVNGLSSNLAARQVCEQLTQPDTVLLYAGRSFLFADLLQEAIAQPGCNPDPARDLHVYTSTDISKLLDDDNTVQSRRFPPFVIHVAEYGNIEQRTKTGLGEALCERLQAQERPPQTADNAQGFDAVALLLTIARQMKDNKELHSAVREHLILNEVGLAGATGNITIGKGIISPNQTDMPITFQTTATVQTNKTCN